MVMDKYNYKSPIATIIKRVNKDSINEYIVFLMRRYSSRGNRIFSASCFREFSGMNENKEIKKIRFVEIIP